MQIGTDKSEAPHAQAQICPYVLPLRQVPGPVPVAVVRTAGCEQDDTQQRRHRPGAQLTVASS